MKWECFCDELELVKHYEQNIFKIIEEFNSSTKKDKEWVENIYKKCKSKHGFTMKDVGYIRLHLRLYFQEKLKFNRIKREFLSSQKLSYFQSKNFHKKCSAHFHTMKKHVQFIQDYIEKKEIDHEILELSNSIKHKL